MTTTTGAGAYTLPLTKTLAEHVERTDRVAYPNEPTWARRINGAGQHQRLHIWSGPSMDDGRPRFIVYGADATSPGDRIEIGPLPRDAVIDVDPYRYSY